MHVTFMFGICHKIYEDSDTTIDKKEYLQDFKNLWGKQIKYVMYIENMLTITSL